jgi:antitoxin (DNA-binding transcriptional repressor) of toxin-antitoxin stability system
MKKLDQIVSVKMRTFCLEGHTMAAVTLEEAQATLPDLIHKLATGEEVAITEGDQVVARLVGERRPLRQRPGPGLCKGMMTIVSDDDDHLKDFAEYMP